MKKYASAEELDEMFDAGVDMSDYWDIENAYRGDTPLQKKIEINLPFSTITKLDTEAARLGIPREAMMTAWIEAHLPV